MFYEMQHFSFAFKHLLHLVKPLLPAGVDRGFHTYYYYFLLLQNIILFI